MKIDLNAMRQMTGSVADANLGALVEALAGAPAAIEATAPHVLAPMLGNVGEESDGFKATREYWGNPPTSWQENYENNSGLGNNQPGDGYRFRGGGLLETTGRRNYGRLTAWAKANYPNAPDFTVTPDAIEEPPWVAVSALFYWSDANCTAFCDAGDFYGLVRSINGRRMLGLSTRFALTGRAGLYLLGRDPLDVRGFQADEQLTVDGDFGPASYAAMHRRLKVLPALQFGG